MKKLSFLFSLVASVALFYAFKSKDEKFSIIGKWNGKDKTGSMIINFLPDGHYEMIQEGKVQKSDEKMELTYKFDNTHSPAWLDLIMTLKAEKPIVMGMEGIVNVIDNNTLKANFGTKERPNEFAGPKVTDFKRIIEK